MKDNGLPPHSLEAEEGALACVLMSRSQPESDALLLRLTPGLFYDLRNRTLLAELVQLRQENHVIDPIVLADWLKGRQRLESIGGLARLGQLSEAAPSVANFSAYLEILQEHALRRWSIAKAARLQELAHGEAVSIDALRGELGEILDKASKIGERPRSMIEVWSIEDAARFVPDASSFLVGADMISKGEISVVAGWQGLGKTRLVNTLALAGARGSGSWMGYDIKRKFRTFILQSENSPRRIQSEFGSVSPECGDWIRISLPCMMDFANPAFRAEIRRLWESWPFDLIIIDNMNDVARADAREDFLEALDNIRAALPPHPHTPAILLVAHLRKQRGGDHWRPKSGRELLHEISGSLVLTAKARTVFLIQPATVDLEDDRLIFETAKCNNDTPLPRSAWRRRNGAFEPIPDFDFEGWLDPEDSRKIVTEDIMERIFSAHGPSMAKSELVDFLMREEGFSQATAYRAASLTGKFKARLWETNPGRIAWRKDKN